jgi:HAD superfamily hydrolase (TIGR01490 family)
MPPSRHLTLFDLDGTLMPLDTNQAFGSYLLQLGWCDAEQWTARNRAFHDDHTRGALDLGRFIEFSTAPWRDRPQHDVEAVRARFVQEVIVPAIPVRSRALVAEHQAAGDLVALVTGTNEFLAEPIAQAFGIEHVIAVRLARDATGRFTGQIDGIPSFHAGKVDRVHEWLAQQGLQLGDFEQVRFYGDSVNDIPIMEQVSHPIAANPSPVLRALAQARGWAVLDLFTHAA